MEKIFKDQTAIISGGIGDIGFATAMALANRGAHIALGDKRPYRDAADSIKMIEAVGVRCQYTTVDVSDARAVQNWVNEVENTMGLIRLVIANAATATMGGIHEISPAQWAGELNVNLNGAFYLTQAATAAMVRQKQPGRVVFVGSWAATHAHQHMPAYSVSKAGMSMLCKCMALELAPCGILVNEIAPGYVEAGLSGRLWSENSCSKERAVERVPTKMVIRAEEVAEKIVFLCDYNNKHMTGSTLLMDGGLSL